MFYVDLNGPNRYQPLDDLPVAQLFEFGCKLAQVMPDICVRAPVGEGPDEAVTLDGKLLCKKGVAFF